MRLICRSPSAVAGSGVFQPDDGVGAQPGCGGHRLVPGGEWLGVQDEHGAVLLVLVEDVGCGESAEPGTPASSDVDGDSQGSSQVTGSSWTP